ncbi:MAG: HD domain-containing protein [Saprospiraceae bacterium]|nr:HD domain-containing protein [Saprospiraceae bacterium]
MNKNIVLQSTITFVQETLQNAEGGHDWWHIHRVWKTAQSIAVNENVDTFVVELAALLHDIADSKFHGGDETVGPKKAQQFLETMGIDENTITHVVKIIENISFKGGNETQHFKSLELDVVQDADRLDAMGAIGIARAFNYGGFKNRKLYDPAIKPNLHKTKEAYKNSTEPTINHFYEKLLLLKDRMNTKTGKEMAIRKHEFMERFLEEFLEEWGA